MVIGMDVFTAAPRGGGGVKQMAVAVASRYLRHGRLPCQHPLAGGFAVQGVWRHMGSRPFGWGADYSFLDCFSIAAAAVLKCMIMPKRGVLVYLSRVTKICTDSTCVAGLVNVALEGIAIYLMLFKNSKS